MEGLLFVDLFFVKLLEPPRYRAAISGRVPSDRYLANLPYYSAQEVDARLRDEHQIQVGERKSAEEHWLVVIAVVESKYCLM